MEWRFDPSDVCSTPTVRRDLPIREWGASANPRSVAHQMARLSPTNYGSSQEVTQQSLSPLHDVKSIRLLKA